MSMDQAPESPAPDIAGAEVRASDHVPPENHPEINPASTLSTGAGPVPETATATANGAPVIVPQRVPERRRRPRLDPVAYTTPTFVVNGLSLLLAVLGLLGFGFGVGIWLSHRPSIFPGQGAVSSPQPSPSTHGAITPAPRVKPTNTTPDFLKRATPLADAGIPLDMLLPEPTRFNELLEVFTGTDLTGWQTPTGLWQAVNGTVLGRADLNHAHLDLAPLRYLGSLVRNFELSFASQGAAPGGVLFRAQAGKEGWTGYLARCNGKEAGHLTQLIPNRRSRQLTLPGRNLIITGENGQDRRVLMGRCAPESALPDLWQPGQWNEFVLIARGRQLVCIINGITVSSVTDQHDPLARTQGELALYFVPRQSRELALEFKNLRLKHLPPATP